MAIEANFFDAVGLEPSWRPTAPWGPTIKKCPHGIYHPEGHAIAYACGFCNPKMHYGVFDDRLPFDWLGPDSRSALTDSECPFGGESSNLAGRLWGLRNSDRTGSLANGRMSLAVERAA